MQKLIDWVKTHKLVASIISIIVLFVIAPILLIIFNIIYRTVSSATSYKSMGIQRYPSSSVTSPLNYEAGLGGGGYEDTYYPDYSPATPHPEITDRMVVKESRYSLLVKDIEKSMDDIKKETKAVGGYMVNSSTQPSEYGGWAEISVRIPEEKLEEFGKHIKGLAVRVTSENISGYDVTDQYVDTEAELAILDRTKATYESILSKATTVEEIMNVQNNLLSVQRQIDSVKGQLKYMEATAKNSLVTIYLSTDELALPYTPENPWSPGAVFKQAVRSMIKTARGLAGVGIWVAVYAVIWVPILILIKVIKKIKKKKIQQPQA